MPIHVDVGRRLDAIAVATIAVARRQGARGITIRAVAAELGGSTARVTNYVPNRTALIATAVTSMLRRWKAERDADLAGLPAERHLLGILRWAVIAEPDDLVFRGLLVELMAQRTDGEPAYYQYAHAFRDELAAAAAAAGAPDAELAGDLMFLLVRGFHYATVEGTDHVPAGRTAAFLARAVELLVRP